LASAPTDDTLRDRPLPAGQAPKPAALLPLATLFGLYYFLQGIGEPGDGLIAQPVRSLLMSWDQSAGDIGAFAFFIGLPWSIKPLYGLISDFLPLGGYRRKSYLMLTSAVSAAALLALSAMPLGSGDKGLLLGLLLFPATGLAFGDVVIDALMVEQAQPRGWTGQLQAVQWTAMFGATALTGVLGGYLSEHHWQQAGFGICGGACLAAMVLAMRAPERRAAAAKVDWSKSAGQLRAACRIPALRATALFLFLWNFNPFSTSVLHFYMTHELKFSEQFFGLNVTVTALASMAAAALYGLLRKAIPFRVLLHGAIVLGIASTAAYWGLRHEFSAQVASAAAGATTAIAILIQLDLAAQVCPLEIAGTVFAVLMSISNLSSSLSIYLGGYWYDQLSESLGGRAAFDALVAIGSLTTAACWFVMPMLLRSLPPTTGANATAGSGR
jgi:MFS family permease